MVKIFKIIYDEDDFNRALEEEKERLDNLEVNWKRFGLIDYIFDNDDMTEELFNYVGVRHTHLGILEYAEVEYVGHIPDGLFVGLPRKHFKERRENTPKDVLYVVEGAEKRLDSYNKLRDKGMFEEIRSKLKGF